MGTIAASKPAGILAGQGEDGRPCRTGIPGNKKKPGCGKDKKRIAGRAGSLDFGGQRKPGLWVLRGKPEMGRDEKTFLQKGKKHLHGCDIVKENEGLPVQWG